MVSPYSRTLALTTALLTLTACGTQGQEDQDPDKLHVVATFSVVHDIAAQVGGEAVDLHSIVPLGTDPHEYTPLPEDIQQATDADLLLWNGLNMETGDGWFESLTEVAGKEIDSPQVVEVSTGVEPQYLTSSDGQESEINPHAFLSPLVGMVYTENIRDALIEVDPDHEETYTSNADTYLDTLDEIDQTYTELVEQIPPENRTLVTSEHAYQYMVDSYGLEAGYIWAIDTDEQGTPGQINDLVELVQEREVPALFVESNVDRRPMETVSTETGVDIVDTLFSDELGDPSGDGATYADMLTNNITRIHAGLSSPSDT